MAGQPRELAEFLEATAVLDRFTPEVAGALSGRSDTRELCRELIRRHLFTVRLEAEGHWYRYHHLFQSFLRARLAARGGEAVRAKHFRAADAGSRPASRPRRFATCWRRGSRRVRSTSSIRLQSGC